MSYVKERLAEIRAAIGPAVKPPKAKSKAIRSRLKANRAIAAANRIPSPFDRDTPRLDRFAELAHQLHQEDAELIEK